MPGYCHLSRIPPDLQALLDFHTKVVASGVQQTGEPGQDLLTDIESLKREIQNARTLKNGYGREVEFWSGRTKYYLASSRFSMECLARASLHRHRSCPSSWSWTAWSWAKRLRLE